MRDWLEDNLEILGWIFCLGVPLCIVGMLGKCEQWQRERERALVEKNHQLELRLAKTQK